MEDVYKLLADISCKSVDDDWDKISIEICSSVWKMFETKAFYIKDNKRIAFELDDDDSDIDLGEQFFKLQEQMSSNHKWNKAFYTLDKNGHFDITFEWDQTLQNKWDNN